MKTVFLLLAVLVCNRVVAQDVTDTTRTAPPVLDELEAPLPPPAPDPDGENTVYDLGALEQLPEFPGGEEKLMEYIRKNVHYPVDAIDAGIEGRVYVEFIVAEDGSVGDVTLRRGVHSSLDMEAMRVVKSLPSFAPGLMLGKPVKVRYTLPIAFKLK